LTPFVFTMSGLLAAFVSRAALADSATVPADVQTTLLAKLERYDRSFAGRAGQEARVLLLVKAGSTKSTVAAEEIRSALARLSTIGGLPHKEFVQEYKTAESLAARCRAERVAVVYLMPGFDSELRDIRSAFATVDVLSLGASPEYVAQGVVLGFELEAGAPKILFNLDQARKQHVDFPADVLRLMKVFR
jgi:hypothetical protein